MARFAHYTTSLLLSAAVVLIAACHECPTLEATPSPEAAVANPGGQTPGAGAPAPVGPKDITAAPVFDSWKLHPDDAGKNVLTDTLTKPLVMPCDFPGRGGIQIFACYDSEDVATINTALDLAAYNVWRVLQVLEKVEKAKTFEARDKLWRTYFTGEHASYEQDGHASLHNWFGPYSASRFNKIHYAYKKVWDMYLGPGWKERRISCNCRAQAMSAHAANPYGIEVCPKFFQKDLFDQARLFVHEFMHDVTGEPGGNIQDTHSECEIDSGDDGLQKCYSIEESLKLAEHHPDVANRNPQNYALYSRRLMEAYHAGKCTDLSLCSPRDVGAPKCQPYVPPSPQYPECEGNPGDVGCPCADVDIVRAEDAAKDGGYPDGEGSFLANKSPGGQFCHGPDVVCAKEKFKGKDIPICKSCSVQPEIGCPCNNDYECGDELTCWGGYGSGFAPVGHGTCLPKETAKLEKLPWFCLDNCAAINSYGEMGAACVYRQVTNLEFDHGTCVNFATPCGMELPGLCEQSGRVCRIDAADNDVCVAECKTKEDCVKGGFPDTYECDAEGSLGYQYGHCVPPGCGSNNSKYCNLFR